MLEEKTSSSTQYFLLPSHILKYASKTFSIIVDVVAEKKCSFSIILNEKIS